MDKEAIQTFFKLSAITRKFTEEDLKNPKNVALCQQQAELQAQYLEWMSAVNDPKKMKAVQEKMQLANAITLLSEAVSVFLQAPVPKSADPEAYQEAFATMMNALREKVAESKKQLEAKEKSESSEEK